MDGYSRVAWVGTGKQKSIIGYVFSIKRGFYRRYIYGDLEDKKKELLGYLGYYNEYIPHSVSR